MAHYAIGDIQGCFEPLQRLLAAMDFNPQHDRLWLTGDLINRGPESLKVLRLIYQLREVTTVVLGNHDLHFLAVAYQALPPHPKDTFADILQADDKAELCNWLRQQRLFYYDPQLQFAISHAGIYPKWTLEQAGQYAAEVEQLLASEQYLALLANQYGNEPGIWNENLTGWERYRFIVNSFTRMRFCTRDGALELTTKTGIDHYPPALIPWFNFPHRPTLHDNLIFGHWAALNGSLKQPHLFALDTGCVWGNCLTALRLEDQRYFKVPCSNENKKD